MKAKLENLNEKAQALAVKLYEQAAAAQQAGTKKVPKQLTTQAMMWWMASLLKNKMLALKERRKIDLDAECCIGKLSFSEVLNVELVVIFENRN